MKKSSNIKYFGIAAATLVSLGVGAATLITPTAAPATAQAATTADKDFPAFAPVMSGTSDTAGSVQVNGQWQSVTLSAGLPINASTKLSTSGPVSGKTYYVFAGATYPGADGKDATGDVYVPAKGLTKQYTVSFYGGATGTAATITTDGTTAAGSDATTSATNDLKTGTLKLDAVYTDGTNTFFAYRHDGQTYFVNTAAVTTSAALTTTDTVGTVTTNDDNMKTYTDPALHSYTGKLVRDKGTELRVDQQASDASGTVIAYHVTSDADEGADTWVPASDVTFTANKLVRQAATGSLTAKDEATIYSDKETTTATDLTLAEGETVTYNVVVKNSIDGTIVAYGIKGDDGTYTYVKAFDMTVNTAPTVKTAALPLGTAVYSDYKPATIYSDPAATKDSGTKLATSVNEWTAFATSTDSDGAIVAYKLGKDQWIKASDLQIEQDLSGTFDTAAGSPLYSSDGTQSGSISVAGPYQVFAVRYINGKQSLKLGTDNQWIKASDGDYYPA
ncbi:hypothetical protein ACFQ5M_02905 [Agrilactobacillus yilanensis]|uniref:Uncharacterized protein n=1 Tax=Agrilactobacillus yilanensis TaxID=2485997 RepID=A0ABW4J4A7_9LACO|nr:hypothetical protein [Agrilactobacillus yilanensis]